MKKWRFSLLCVFILSACVGHSTAEKIIHHEYAINDASERDALTNDVMHAVFTIYREDENGALDAIGSGFFIEASGLAVTNHHVIAGWSNVMARTYDGVFFDILGYYYYDIDNDIALIQVDGDNFSFLTMGDSDTLQVDDSVQVISSPDGVHNVVTDGYVVRLAGIELQVGLYAIDDLIVMNATVAPGSSGGALLNEQNEVVGVIVGLVNRENWGILFRPSSENLGLVVPINRIDLALMSETVFAFPIDRLTVDLDGFNFVDRPGAFTDHPLVGVWTWDGTGELWFAFYSDGTAENLQDGEQFIWFEDGSMRAIIYEMWELENDRLSITWSNGQSFSYTRVE